jgi:hypothetical protein
VTVSPVYSARSDISPGHLGRLRRWAPGLAHARTLEVHSMQGLPW